MRDSERKRPLITRPRCRRIDLEDARVNWRHRLTRGSDIAASVRIEFHELNTAAVEGAVIFCERPEGLDWINVLFPAGDRLRDRGLM